MIKNYVCIDLETTGLNPKTDKIIEIGAVRVAEGEIVDSFSTFVNPGRQLEQRIVELTGIRDVDLCDAPYIEEVTGWVIDFLGEDILLGHSILFDYSFMKKAAVNRNLEFEKMGIDTLKIARKYLADLEHRNLDYLCEYYGIPHNAHRALEDAKATHLLYQRLAEQFYTEEEALFKPEKLLFKVKKDSPASKQQKERLYKLLEQHKISLCMDVEKLTKSEVSRLTDKIRAGHISPSGSAL